MSERILPEASLTPVASPVDRYVRPQEQFAEASPWLSVAKSLEKLNPDLTKFIGAAHANAAATEEAQGVNAAQGLDPVKGFRENKEGWDGLIKQARTQDAQNGTNNATALVGASPHFRRGLIKAKANRLGLGLAAHMQNLWEKDDAGIKSIDDPVEVQKWIQERTEAYSEQFGLSEIDPLITANTYAPRVDQAAQALIGKHMTYRAQERVAEFGREFQAGIGLTMSGAGNGASSVDDFITKMSGSESSFNSKATRTNKDGRVFSGWLQFGQKRLTDYNNANGTNYTLEEFRLSETIQAKAGVWHINDIDKYIQSRGYLGQGYSLDGLRAVAHLGGKGGLDHWVANGGTSTRKDENGTSLNAYYAKFAGAVGDLQSQVDRAIANNLDPKVVNKQLVTAVIAQAEQTGDASLLNVLDEIQTGNGPLGNIGWVKQARNASSDRIVSDKITRENREYTQETRAKAAAKDAVKLEGYRTILTDPFSPEADKMITDARDNGHADVAVTMLDLQERMQDSAFEVRTNHEAVFELRADIFRGETSDAEMLERISEGIGVLFPQSVAVALIDDLDKGKGSSDLVRDPEVRRHVDRVRDIINERFTQKDILGNLISSGKENAMEAEQEIVDELLIFLEDNPEASKARVRKFVRDTARDVLKRPEYATPRLDEEPVTELEGEQTTDPLAGFSKEEINAAAQARGMTPEAFIATIYQLQGYTPE